MGLLNVLACFMIACIVIGSTRGQSLTVDKANLCSTYQYRVHWNGWSAGQYIQATSNLAVGTAFFSFTPTTAEGYANWYLLPSANATYTVRLIGNDSLVLASDDFSADPCQNLRTYGLAPELQAIVVLDYHRANNSLSSVFYNSLLETVAGLLATGNTTELSTAFQLAGQSYAGNALGIISQGTAFFDAGSWLQSMLFNNNGQKLVGQVDEVGAGYSQAHAAWVLIAGTRSKVLCGDKFVAGSEQCDDGNRDPNDGCASDCTVENGWMCSEDILQEGSVCSRTPVDAPSAQTGPNTPSQSATPIAQNRGSVTKEAGTLALLLALIAVVLSF